MGAKGRSARESAGRARDAYERGPRRLFRRQTSRTAGDHFQDACNLEPGGPWPRALPRRACRGAAGFPAFPSGWNGVIRGAGEVGGVPFERLRRWKKDSRRRTRRRDSRAQRDSRSNFFQPKAATTNNLRLRRMISTKRCCPLWRTRNRRGDGADHRDGRLIGAGLSDAPFMPPPHAEGANYSSSSSSLVLRPRSQNVRRRRQNSFERLRRWKRDSRDEEEEEGRGRIICAFGG